MLGCKFAANPSIDRPLYKVNSQALFSPESVKRMPFALFGGFSKLITTFVEKTRGLSPSFAQIGLSISVPNSPQRRKVRQVQEPGKKLLVRSSLLRIEKTRGLPPSFVTKTTRLGRPGHLIPEGSKPLAGGKRSATTGGSRRDSRRRWSVGAGSHSTFDSATESAVDDGNPTAFPSPTARGLSPVSCHWIRFSPVLLACGKAF
jgi:hypothetical protein